MKSLRVIRRPLPCTALGLGLLWATVAAAQPAPAPPVWSYLTDRNHGSVQIVIILGRMSVRSSVWNQEILSPSSGESCKMRWDGGEGAIRYEQILPTGSFSVEAFSDGRFTVRRDGGEKSTELPLQFLQLPDGAASLIVGRDSSRKVYQAASLWHLTLAWPKQCRRYLFPLLATLPCGDELPPTAAAIEEELLHRAVPSDLSDRLRLEMLVRQLGDNRFAVRKQPSVSCARSARRPFGSSSISIPVSWTPSNKAASSAFARRGSSPVSAKRPRRPPRGWPPTRRSGSSCWSGPTNRPAAPPPGNWLACSGNPSRLIRWPSRNRKRGLASNCAKIEGSRPAPSAEPKAATQALPETP